MRSRTLGILASVLLVASLLVVVGVGTSRPASADGCYTWNRTLRQGMSGGDVRQLQIRLAGWVSRGENLAVDGIFGPRTAAAVKRFKAGYNIGTTSGVAGRRVFDKLYYLQDSNCTPRHFDYGEFNDNCGANNFSGGKVSASTAKRNMLRVMWQLEALRHKRGDRPIVITSGFRSVSCNRAVGGSSTSLHMYGKAADLGTASGPTLCQMWRSGRSAGFEELLGPGYPNHGDHTHVANRSSQFWSASRC